MICQSSADWKKFHYGFECVSGQHQIASIAEENAPSLPDALKMSSTSIIFQKAILPLTMLAAVRPRSVLPVDIGGTLTATLRYVVFTLRHCSSKFGSISELLPPNRIFE